MTSIPHTPGFTVALKRVSRLDPGVGEKSSKTVYDYHVLIDGLHRATWVKSWYKTDYNLHTPDGKPLKGTQTATAAVEASDFVSVKVLTRVLVTNGTIPRVKPPPKPSAGKAALPRTVSGFIPLIDLLDPNALPWRMWVFTGPRQDADGIVLDQKAFEERLIRPIGEALRPRCFAAWADRRSALRPNDIVLLKQCAYPPSYTAHLATKISLEGNSCFISHAEHFVLRFLPEVQAGAVFLGLARVLTKFSSINDIEVFCRNTMVKPQMDAAERKILRLLDKAEHIRVEAEEQAARKFQVAEKRSGALRSEAEKLLAAPAVSA